MLKNHLVVAIRNLFRNKLNTLIIIIGLGIGITCSTLSFLFIANELSFDRFHENLSEIYEVKMVLALSFGRAVSVPKAQTAIDIIDQFPEVKSAVRMEKQNLIVYFDGNAYEENALAADPSFLDVFTFPFEAPLDRNVFLRRDSVVLSQTAAQKYFGDNNPLGEVLSIRVGDTPSDFLVAGVLKQIPNASSLDFDFLIPLNNVYGDGLNDGQRSPSLSCFIQLTDAKFSQTLQDKFRNTIDIPLREKYSDGSGHVLQSFADFHLKGEMGSYVLSHKSHIQFSLILAGISLLVLLIASFNFINLTIGKASSRIKEIGVRKVVGAQRSQLVKQFWFESLLFGFLSLLIGLVMTELIIPAFNSLIQKNLGLDLFASMWIIVFFIGLVLLVGIVAGSYPAFLLSKFNPVELFRGEMKISRKSTFSRTLIILQFAISIFLVVSTIFLLKQKTHMLNTSLGYKTEQVIIVSLKNITGESKTSSVFLQTLKSKLLPYDSIDSVSGSHFSFPEGWMGTYFEDKSGEPNLVVYNYVDQDFIPTLGMTLIQGRNFSDDFPADREGAIIINESFLKILGVNDPLGCSLNEFFSTDFDRTIIGVVKDFHYESLRDPIYPAFIGMAGMDYQNIFVKIKGDGIRESLAFIENEFKSLAPQIPFEFSFLDEAVARQYERENHWIQLVEFASFFAILIACSGLFGLTLQILFLRTKEIGIRRVLGASIRNILFLINREFMWLVLVSNILAWPAAYFAVSAFLGNYSYRVAITPWVFLVSGLLGLLLAVFTVSIHALKTAKLNPAKTLKTE
jgi:putative ABC transport system permease protein